MVFWNLNSGNRKGINLYQEKYSQSISEHFKVQGANHAKLKQKTL